MNTSAILKVLEQRGLYTGIDMHFFQEAEWLSNQIFVP